MAAPHARAGILRKSKKKPPPVNEDIDQFVSKTAALYWPILQNLGFSGVAGWATAYALKAQLPCLSPPWPPAVPIMYSCPCHVSDPSSCHLPCLDVSTAPTTSSLFRPVLPFANRQPSLASCHLKPCSLSLVSALSYFCEGTTSSIQLLISGGVKSAFCLGVQVVGQGLAVVCGLLFAVFQVC